MYFVLGEVQTIRSFFDGMTFLFKKTETELKIQILNGEFVFYVSKFILLLQAL